MNTRAGQDKNLFKCRRGCGQSFKHKTQLYRHKKKCTVGNSPMKKREKYIRHGKKFMCLNCEKLFPNQPNVVRHASTCVIRPVHQCRICDKVFQFKCRLTQHERIHVNEVEVPSFLSVENQSIPLEERPAHFVEEPIHLEVILICVRLRRAWKFHRAIL